MYNLYAVKDSLYDDDDNFMRVNSFSSRSKAEGYINKRWPDALKSRDDEGHVYWSISLGRACYNLYISTL